MIHKKLNEGLRAAQKKRVTETEAKILEALEKQNKNKKVNITKLSEDSGISRQQIMRRYHYLYDGRQNESDKVLKLKDELNSQVQKNKKLARTNSQLSINNKNLREKLLELNVIIIGLSKKLQHAKIESK